MGFSGVSQLLAEEGEFSVVPSQPALFRARHETMVEVEHF